jgi:RsmE family RNA methyltransferase
MNLLLLDPGELDGRRAVVRGPRLVHAREVLRACAGETLRVGVIGGAVGEATIVAVDEHALVLDCTLDRAPPPAVPVSLVLALPRPPVLRRALEHLAALGVKRVALIHTARTEKSYWSSHALAPAAITAALHAGLAQGRDTVVPDVTLHPRFRPFVEDVLPGWCEGQLFVAHPASVRWPAQPCPAVLPAPATVAVGPEGGFVDAELERLAAAGAMRVGLGPRPLRVETAVTVLIGRALPGAEGSVAGGSALRA